MRYKAVIFDFDYTLGDSTDGIVMSIQFALDQMGYDRKDRETIKKTIGMSLKNTFEYLTGNQDEEMAARFTQLFKQKADEVMVAGTELYAETKKVLSFFRENSCLTGIVTTKYHFRIEQILAKFDAVSLIDHIIGGDDVKVEKPDAEGLLYMIGLMGVGKEEVLYIGDSWIDAQTARNGGVDFAGVLTGTTSRDEFEKYPHVCVVENLAELLMWGED